MKKCPSCDAMIPDWRPDCPECGTHQKKERKTVLAWAVVIIMIIVAGAVFITMISLSKPCGGGTCGGGQHTAVALTPTQIDLPCSPPPAVSAVKLPDGRIRLTVMGGACLSQVKAFGVKVDNTPVNVALGKAPGSSATITTPPGEGGKEGSRTGSGRGGSGSGPGSASSGNGNSNSSTGSDSGTGTGNDKGGGGGGGNGAGMIDGTGGIGGISGPGETHRVVVVAHDSTGKDTVVLDQSL